MKVKFYFNTLNLNKFKRQIRVIENSLNVKIPYIIKLIKTLDNI